MPKEQNDQTLRSPKLYSTLCGMSQGTFTKHLVKNNKFRREKTEICIFRELQVHQINPPIDLNTTSPKAYHIPFTSTANVSDFSPICSMIACFPDN